MFSDDLASSRKYKKLIAVVLMISSVYYIFQSHVMLSTVMKPMESRPLSYDTPTYDDDDNVTSSSSDYGSNAVDYGDMDEQSNMRRKSGSDESVDIPTSQVKRKNGTGPTPFYNETHISCFYKITKHGKSEWRQKIVRHDTFWKKKNCKFRLGRDTIYFHQGKAGGGTVNYMGNKYRLGLRSDHPVLKDDSVKDLIEGPLTTLIFTVRDPVDRFVSMFNWRLLTLCHPGDKRKKTITNEDADTGHKLKQKSIWHQRVTKKKQVGGHAEHPEKFCLSTRVEQEKTLRVRYKGDPNVMAEALCENSPEYERAVRDLTDINHSTTIAQWLQLLIDPTMVGDISKDGIQNFAAIPVTSRFEDDLDALFTAMLEEKYGSNILDAMPDGVNKKYKNKKAAMSHSSVKHGKDKPRQLSKLAECCLARYYQKDYRVIQTMLRDDTTTILDPIKGAHPVLGEACNWGDVEQQQSCKDDLRTMLQQRSSYITQSQEHTCSDLVKHYTNNK